MSQQINVLRGIYSYPSQHLNLYTKNSNKNIKLNSQTFTSAASIVAVQVKPRAGVNMTNDVIGIESGPGINNTFTSSGGIVCFKAEPYTGATVGAISGDIRGYEVSLGVASGAGSQTGGMYGIEFINNSAKSFTGGIYPIFVNTHGDSIAWSGFAKLPADSQVAGATAPSTLSGWIKVLIGSNVRYIGCYTNATGG